MSGSEGFLSRWSRRKREGLQESEPANPVDKPGEDDHASDKVSPHNASAPAESAFDPASLPAIESITAETDISGFLAADVPSDLTRAALRRAWTSDPKIRNFVGLADYDWDFNAAGSMAGFGPLDIVGAVRKVGEGIAEPNRTGAEASDGLDPAATTPKTQPIASEAGLEGDRPAAVEADNQARQTADAATQSSTSPHRHEPVGHRVIALQDKAERHDEIGSFIKRRHGGALPK
jgi:hypothetical protein